MYYEIIKDFYGDQKAKRSGVPYINHIDEGLMIMDALGSTQDAKDAFCVHPILQLPESLIEADVSDWNPRVVLLAMEYRNKANAYSSHGGSKPPKMILPEVTDMLIADKLQNFRDFITHEEKYPAASLRLRTYFIDWLYHLGLKRYIYLILCGATIEELLEELKNEQKEKQEIR